MRSSSPLSSVSSIMPARVIRRKPLAREPAKLLRAQAAHRHGCTILHLHLDASAVEQAHALDVVEIDDVGAVDAQERRVGKRGEPSDDSKPTVPPARMRSTVLGGS
jgi:hypothetical protein